jgi:short-subunit dehydrogenase
MDLNVLAVAICTREASRLMRKHKVQGHIININSIAGHNATNIPIHVSLYCASKYALTGMTESLRNEFTALNCGIKISVSQFDMLTRSFRKKRDSFSLRKIEALSTRKSCLLIATTILTARCILSFGLASLYIAMGASIIVVPFQFYINIIFYHFISNTLPTRNYLYL